MNSWLHLLSKIKINPFFWIIIGAGIITGYFREVLMIFVIVFVHEMGHSVMAHFFKWRIKKIELLPFGGVAEVEEYGNRPFKEELLVIIAGPLQHLWLMGLSFLCVPLEFWTAHDHHVFIQHNLMILLFNLLPIWPLDGGKLLFLLYTYTWPFREAHRIFLVTSFSILMVGAVTSLFLFPFHLNLWIIVIFLLISHYLEWRQRHYVYMRFLMERYYFNPIRQHDHQTLPIHVPGEMTVGDVVKKFRRGVQHKIIIDNKKAHFFESDVLQAYFERKNIWSKVGDIFT